MVLRPLAVCRVALLLPGGLGRLLLRWSAVRHPARFVYSTMVGDALHMGG